MKVPYKVYKITLHILFFLLQSIKAQPDPQIQHIYPIPGTIEHPAKTQIIVRFNNLTPDQIKNFESFIEVTAEDGMAVDGKNLISSDNKTTRYFLATSAISFNSSTEYVRPVGFAG